MQGDGVPNEDYSGTTTYGAQDTSLQSAWKAGVLLASHLPIMLVLGNGLIVTAIPLLSVFLSAY